MHAELTRNGRCRDDNRTLLELVRKQLHFLANKLIAHHLGIARSVASVFIEVQDKELASERLDLLFGLETSVESTDDRTQVRRRSDRGKTRYSSSNDQDLGSFETSSSSNFRIHKLLIDTRGFDDGMVAGNLRLRAQYVQTLSTRDTRNRIDG